MLKVNEKEERASLFDFFLMKWKEKKKHEVGWTLSVTYEFQKRKETRCFGDHRTKGLVNIHFAGHFYSCTQTVENELINRAPSFFSFLKRHR